MHIIFCGTPQFAVPTLERLLAAGFTIDLVVTNPDEPSGRSYERKAPPVKLAAEKAGLPVFQPAKLRDPATRDLLVKFHPDAIVVVAYGHIIPPWMIELPRLGSINLHASLLPKYRGAAPIAWALIRGERVTGVTTMKIDAGLDTGGILLKREDGRIDWSWTAEEIARRVRGLRPWPVAYTAFRGKTLRIWSATPALLPPESQDTSDPGAIIVQGDRLFVACGQSTFLEVREVQLEWRKRLPARDFVNGSRLASGEAI